MKEDRPEDELAARSRTTVARLRRPDVQQSYLVPVLCKALGIMRLLEKSEGPMNVDQVCRATGYPKSTVYRILRTLSAHGFLPHGDDGIYAFRPVSRKREGAR